MILLPVIVKFPEPLSKENKKSIQKNGNLEDSFDITKLLMEIFL